MPNAINMLTEDHGRLRRLLSELTNTTDRATKERVELVKEIEKELKTHAQIEEEIFYPAFKKAAKKDDQDLFYEATEEHHVVDMVLPALKAANPKSPEFEAKAKVLKDLIEHHAEEEETEMFTKARRIFGAQKLNELGDLMKMRREMIEAMWENPLLRPVKALQGLVQKASPTSVKNVKAAAIGIAMEKSPKKSSAKKKKGGAKRKRSGAKKSSSAASAS